jgi:hypothetical protein
VNPWHRRLEHTPDAIRRRLFKAGWHPSMAGMPVTDEKISALLLELNAANAARTMRKLRR